jgi:hypothetical protein
MYIYSPLTHHGKVAVVYCNSSHDEMIWRTTDLQLAMISKPFQSPLRRSNPILRPARNCPPGIAQIVRHVLLCLAALCFDATSFLNAGPCNICFTSLSFSQSHHLPALSVRRGSIGRCSSLRRTRIAPLTRPAVARRCIASIDTAVSCTVHRWTLCTTKIHAIHATAVAL